MKKIILTLSGVLFVIVTGCSLLICMMNGIPNLDQPAAAFYLAKAVDDQKFWHDCSPSMII